VVVTVGGNLCNVEYATPTEIHCRTPEGSEEPESIMDQGSFAELYNLTLTGRHTVLADVTTVEDCKYTCQIDATCLAFSFAIDCRLTDFEIGNSSEFLTNDWVEETGAVGGFIPWPHRPDETSCYTGRGGKYIGDLNITENGNYCQNGTFCRNDDPENVSRPRCKINPPEEAYNWEYCTIVLCDEVWGKYIGNRGASGSILRQDIGMDLTPVRFRPGLISPRDNIVTYTGEFSPGKHANTLNYYSVKLRTNFMAPFDGTFVFFAGVDDRLRLFSDFDSPNGGYTKEFEISSWCDSTTVPCKAGAVSKRYNLKKGESVRLQTITSESGGGDYVAIGAQYLGKYGNGTWIDDTDAVF